MDKMSVDSFWEEFLNDYPEYKNKTYSAWEFGVDATKLSELVKEGEGDKTLEYWRREHYKFFIPLFESYDLEFTDDDIMVCEEFECLFSK